MEHCHQNVQSSNGLSRVKRSDPYAKEIVAGSDRVDIFTWDQDTYEWVETYPQTSVFVYRRNIEPQHILFVLDDIRGCQELILLTSAMKFHFDGPFMFSKDRNGLIRCFQFNTADDFNRIGKVVHQIMQQFQQKTNYVSVLSMLADAQGMFDNVDQPASVDTAMPSLASRIKTAPSHVTSTLDVQNDENERIPSSYERISPEPSKATSQVNAAWTTPPYSFADNKCGAGNVTVGPLNERRPPNDARTVPESKHVFDFLPPAAKKVNKPMPPLVRASRCFDNSNAPRSSTYPMNRKIPFLSCTNPATSNSMSSLEAVNAAMAHDQYQVNKSIPSYSYCTPESTCSVDMTSLANAPKKRTLPAPIRVDQLEKRQKISSTSSHHLTSNMMDPMFDAREMKARLDAKPKLYSPLMFMDVKQSPKETNTSTLTERAGVVRMHQSEAHDRAKKFTRPSIWISVSPIPQIEQFPTVRSETEQFPSGVSRANISEGRGKPEPLTKDQLLQAVSHLIKTDKDFVHRLHAAYLQSFVDILPL